MKCTICILGAGESKRFRGEKLLSVYGKKTISEQVLEKLNNLNDDDSFSFHKIIITKPQLMNYFRKTASEEWQLFVNESYKEGMSTSLKMGISEGIKNQSDYLLLFLGDMPMIKKSTINSVLKQMHQSAGSIIRPVFNGQPGFPVALPKILFEELTLLRGDIGAKPVIEKHRAILK